MLEAILAIPSAIHSTVELIKHVRKSADIGAAEGGLLDRVDKDICAILENLDQFSKSSKDLEAWKEVHHITQRLAMNLTDTFRFINSGRQNFLFKFNQEIRGMISAEFMTARRKDEALPELRVLSTKIAIFNLVQEIPGIETDGKRWDLYIISAVSDAERALNDGNLSYFFDIVTQLYETVSHLNMLADYRLKEGVAKYHNVMQRLHSEIEKLRT